MACHMVDGIIAFACSRRHAPWRIGSEGPALPVGKRVKWALFLDMNGANAPFIRVGGIPALAEKKGSITMSFSP